MSNGNAEQWLPVVDWEPFYEVSDYGRVRTLPKTVSNRYYPQVIKKLGTVPPYGYKLAGLCAEGRKAQINVHVLVLTAFVGPRSPGLVGCHNDGDPSNNHLSNLRWDTQSNNILDTLKHGTNPNANKTHCPHGHEYTPENTRITNWKGRRPGRLCVECQRIRNLAGAEKARVKRRAASAGA